MSLDNSDVIWIKIDSSAFSLCAKEAKAAELGGTSQLRTTDRMNKLRQDQLVGQLGCCALSLYQTGGIEQYRLSRWFVNLDASRGDGGSDFPGSNIDVKTSRLRADWNIEDILDLNLLVRPAERHAKNVYILTVAVPPINGENWYVGLIGWATNSDLPTQPSVNEKFNGAFHIPAYRLKPLMPLRWFKVP